MIDIGGHRYNGEMDEGYRYIGPQIHLLDMIKQIVRNNAMIQCNESMQTADQHTAHMIMKYSIAYMAHHLIKPKRAAIIVQHGSWMTWSCGKPMAREGVLRNAKCLTTQRGCEICYLK